MNNPHSPASYPAKSVHTILWSLAASFDAIVRYTEDLPYQVAAQMVHDNIQTTVVKKKDLDYQEKNACEELEKIFVDYWKAQRVSYEHRRC